MGAENQRPSNNFEDRGRGRPEPIQEDPLPDWLRQGIDNVRRGAEVVMGAFTPPPEKDVRNRYYIPTGPDPSDDPTWAMNNYITETWYHLREAQPEYLERLGPEFVSARRLIDQAETEHGYLNDNEALAGFLYDLDSRGIRMASYWGQDGKERLEMRVHEYDYAGNRIADSTIAESRALVESRMLHVFAQSVVEGRPSVAGIAETSDNSRTSPITPKTF